MSSSRREKEGGRCEGGREGEEVWRGKEYGAEEDGLLLASTQGGDAITLRNYNVFGVTTSSETGKGGCRDEKESGRACVHLHNRTGGGREERKVRAAGRTCTRMRSGVERRKRLELP